jgi:hypothetical protein
LDVEPFGDVPPVTDLGDRRGEKPQIPPKAFLFSLEGRGVFSELAAQKRYVIKKRKLEIALSDPLRIVGEILKPCDGWSTADSLRRSLPNFPTFNDRKTMDFPSTRLNIFSASYTWLVPSS